MGHLGNVEQECEVEGVGHRGDAWMWETCGGTVASEEWCLVGLTGSSICGHCCE